MPVVFYDSNTTLDETIDVSKLTAPTTDDTGIQATRNMWFDFSALPLQRMMKNSSDVLLRSVVDTTIDPSPNKGVCFINDLSITIKKDPSHPKVYYQQAGNHESECVVVSISFVPNVKATDLDDAYDEDGTTAATPANLESHTELFVTEGNASSLYAKEGDVPIANNSYDVALGCYTWEQIYSTPHAVVSTQNATNGANAATFGTLIYDKDSMKKHRQEAYTQIFRKIYGDLFGLHTEGHADAPAANVYYETIDGKEVHTFEMYVCIKDDGSGTAPINTVTGYHDVDWYVSTGDDLGVMGKKITTEVGDAVDSSQISGRFWRDMIIEHADLSGNIDFGPPATASETSVFQFNSVSEKRDDNQNPIFDTPSIEFDNMMAKNFSSMLVNVLNHHNSSDTSSIKRNWMILTGPTDTSLKRSMFGVAGDTVSTDMNVVGRKLVTTRFQTNHHHKFTGQINLQFEQNMASVTSGGIFNDSIDPGSFGDLVEVNIPIKSSNYGNDGVNDDAYTLFLRANLDLTFDVDGAGTADKGTVFYGQKTGKMTEMMFGIFVKPIDSTNINAMRNSAITAKEAYETTKMKRDIIHGYNEEIQGHMDRFTEIATELEATDDSFKSLENVGFLVSGASTDTSPFKTARTKLNVNISNLSTHYANVFADVTDAANYSNDVDAAYSTTVAAAKAALAQEAATDAEAERVAAKNEMETTTADNGFAHENAKSTMEKLLTLMKLMESALVMGGSTNGETDPSTNHGDAIDEWVDGTGSSDAFYHAHAKLSANMANCVAMTSTVAAWKVSIDNIVTNGSTLNYDDELNIIAAQTIALATLNTDLGALRTELDVIGGADGSLRGNGDGDVWNHSGSMFPADLTAAGAITYATMETEFEKMDKLIEARDILLARTATMDALVGSDGNGIKLALDGVQTTTIGKTELDGTDLTDISDFTNIEFI